MNIWSLQLVLTSRIVHKSLDNERAGSLWSLKPQRDISHLCSPHLVMKGRERRSDMAQRSVTPDGTQGSQNNSRQLWMG